MQTKRTATQPQAAAPCAADPCHEPLELTLDDLTQVAGGYIKHTPVPDSGKVHF